MDCKQCKELLGQYWDLPEDDLIRQQLDEHLLQCADCAEEFALWQQSFELIQQSSVQPEVDTQSKIASQVMQRIYQDEGWREPIPHRIYSISYKLRRNLTLAISFFLALFTVGFLYLILSEAEPEPVNYSFDGLMPVASAVGDSGAKTVSISVPLQGVPVASLSDPFVLGVNSIKDHPDYLVVVSILGIICTLLVMNWFSRIRA